MKHVYSFNSVKTWLVLIALLNVMGIKAQYSGTGNEVLLQGFNWASNNTNWLNTVNSKVTDFKTVGIDAVWLPPVSDAVDNNGYIPRQLYNLSGRYGNQTDLTNLIGNLHNNNIKAIADIVINHRGGTTGWCDFTNPTWGLWSIVNNDEGNCGTGAADYNPGDLKADGSGGGYTAARDIDHTNVGVRDEIVAWMNWLKNTIGFDGWRYDYVHGYWGGYTKEYNQRTNPFLSVGELLEGDAWRIEKWINNTENNSMAFDFATKRALQDAFSNNNLGLLNNAGKAPGVIGNKPGKAVTMLDNHDTGPSPNQGHWVFPGDKVERGYAYLLTHPGMPMIFWDHLYNWGIFDKLKQMVQIRKQQGITSTSTLQIVQSQWNLYAAIIGDKVAMKLGGGSWDPGAGWTLALSGTEYAIWTKSVANQEPTSANTSITMNNNTTYTFSTSNFAFTSPAGATFAGIQITALPTAGSLKYNGVAAAINTDYANPALLTFTPVAGASGTPYTTFSFKVKDNAGRLSVAAYTMTANVNNANPTSANYNTTINVNSTYTFYNADFPFTSPVGATFAGFQITSLPAAGSLKYNGVAVTINTDYTTPSLLTFTPVANASGTPYTTFLFKVKDNAGRYSTNAYTQTFNVAVLNSNPTSANKTVTTNVSTTYTFSTADFAFTSPVGSTFAGIQVASLPTVGSLKYNGVAAVINTDYANPALLTYTPVTGATGSPYTTFTFKVKDNAGRYSQTANTITVNVGNINPTSADFSVLTAINTTYTFAASDFPYSSPTGVPMANVVITQLPTVGTLKYNGVVAVVNQECVYPNLITYTPVTGGTGVPYATFKFKVRDLGNVNTSTLAYTATIGVAAAGVNWYPANPTINDVITVTINSSTVGGKLHWGVNGVGTTWTTPNSVYRPAGSVLYNGTGTAVQSPFTNMKNNLYSIKIGPFNNAVQSVSKVDFVIAYDNGTWNNNGGGDFHITVSNGVTTPVGGNTTVTARPNTAYTFATSNFPFTGVNGSTFAGVKVVTLPSVGSLTYNGVAAVANTDYANVALLVYKGANGGIGSPYTSFTFKVKDSNGQYSTANYTATVNVVPETGVKWYPANPTKNDVITVTINTATQGAKLHWGVNAVGTTWTTPNSVYRPAGSTLWNGTGPAVESAFSGPTNSILSINIGPFNNAVQTVNTVDFVIHYNDNTWNNNTNSDFHITLAAAKSLTTGITEPKATQTLAVGIYPNPLTDISAVNVAGAKADEVHTLRVFDLAGKCVATKSFVGEQTYIERSNIISGLYIVRVENANGTAVCNTKLMVE